MSFSEDVKRRGQEQDRLVMEFGLKQEREENFHAQYKDDKKQSVRLLQKVRQALLQKSGAKI